jgi:hypothetical protein
VAQIASRVILDGFALFPEASAALWILLI